MCDSRCLASVFLPQRFSEPERDAKAPSEPERSRAGLRYRKVSRGFLRGREIVRVLRNNDGGTAPQGFGACRKNPSGFDWQRQFFGNVALGRKALRSGTGQEGVRELPQGSDARTASEHLAPFPVPGPQKHHAPKKRSGARLPLATEPRHQRQLMLTASTHLCAEPYTGISGRSTISRH